MPTSKKILVHIRIDQRLTTDATTSTAFAHFFPGSLVSTAIQPEVSAPHSPGFVHFTLRLFCTLENFVSSNMNNHVERRGRPSKMLKLGYLSNLPPKSTKERNLMHASNKKIFIGPRYQADLPEVLALETRNDYEQRSFLHECLMWQPSEKMSEDKLIALVAELKPKGFDEDQILAFLRYQKYDIDATLVAFNNNFVGKQEGMPLHDRVLFVQGYGFHGKNFERIHDLVPNHSVQMLINHYYTEFKRKKQDKLSATRPEFEVRKLTFGGPMEGRADTSFPGTSLPKGKRPMGRPRIIRENTNVLISRLPETAEIDEAPRGGEGGVEGGLLDIRLRQTDMLSDSDEKEEKNGEQAEKEAELQKLDAEIAAEKQRIKNLTSDETAASDLLKETKLDPLGPFEEDDAVLQARMESQKEPSALWHQNEITMFMRALVEFGTDFLQASRLLPNKTEQQVRNMFYNRGYFYGLDKLVKFHNEKEAGKARKL